MSEVSSLTSFVFGSKRARFELKFERKSYKTYGVSRIFFIFFSFRLSMMRTKNEGSKCVTPAISRFSGQDGPLQGGELYGRTTVRLGQIGRRPVRVLRRRRMRRRLRRTGLRERFAGLPESVSRREGLVFDGQDHNDQIQNTVRYVSNQQCTKTPKTIGYRSANVKTPVY